MATNEYNQEQSGARSELDEPRRTTESTGLDQSQSQGGYGGTDGAEGGEGGYGGVSESDPPHHKMHSDDEPLPKPTSGMDDQQEDFSTPTATGTGADYGDDSTKMGTGGDYGDDSKEKFKDSPSEEPQTGSYDDTPATQTKDFGGEEKPSEGYSDPSSAFPDAPVDQTVQDRGYGQDDTASDPMSTDPMSTDPSTESSTPKGFVQKIKDKLPGHSKSDTPDTMEDETPMDTGTPKKGLMTKIKEKLPGHHTSTEPTSDY